MSGEGEALRFLARDAAGDAVVQALLGLLQCHPVEKALFPVDVGFQEIADGGFGGIAETVRDTVPALFTDRVFHDALRAVVVLVDYPRIRREGQELGADFASLEGSVGFEGIEPLLQL